MDRKKKGMKRASRMWSIPEILCHSEEEEKRRGEEREHEVENKLEIKNEEEKPLKKLPHNIVTSEMKTSESMLMQMSFDIFETWRRSCVLLSPLDIFLMPGCIQNGNNRKTIKSLMIKKMCVENNRFPGRWNHSHIDEELVRFLRTLG